MAEIQILYSRRRWLLILWSTFSFVDRRALGGPRLVWLDEKYRGLPWQ